MLTRMTDADWAIVVEAFRAARSRRGDKGRDDRKFLEALHYGVWPLEQRLEAVLAAEPAGRVRGDARHFGWNERHRSPRSDGRFDDRARPCLGGRCKGAGRASSRSRARRVFHQNPLEFDFDGLPLAFT